MFDSCKIYMDVENLLSDLISKSDIKICQFMGIYRYLCTHSPWFDLNDKNHGIDLGVFVVMKSFWRSELKVKKTKKNIREASFSDLVINSSIQSILFIMEERTCLSYKLSSGWCVPNANDNKVQSRTNK